MTAFELLFDTGEMSGTTNDAYRKWKLENLRRSVAMAPPDSSINVEVGHLREIVMLAQRALELDAAGPVQPPG